MPVGHLYVFFEKCLFRSCAHFLIGLFTYKMFLMLSCMSCLNILDINPYQSCHLQTFVPFSCLFTVLMVFFAMQKLFSVIRSYFFIFAFLSRQIQKYLYDL